MYGTLYSKEILDIYKNNGLLPFLRKQYLRRHERCHSGEKRFECAICSKRFAQTADLDVHSRVHSGEKPYKCHVCDKAFSQLPNMICHTRVHTGERPYKWNFVSNSGHRKFCFGMSIVLVYVYIDYRTTLCVFFLVSEVDCPLNVHSYVGCQRVTARMCRCVQFACCCGRCCYRSHGSHCRLHQIPGLSRTPEAFFHDPVISQQCFDIETDSSY